MQDNRRNWVNKLENLCDSLTLQQVQDLQQLARQQLGSRVALGLQIAILRSRLIQEPSQPTTPQLVPTDPPVQSDSPSLAPAQVTEAPAGPRPRKKVSFSAVSLDDASSLLSAFGASGSEDPKTTLPKNGSDASTVDLL